MQAHVTVSATELNTRAPCTAHSLLLLPSLSAASVLQYFPHPTVFVVLLLLFYMTLYSTTDLKKFYTILRKNADTAILPIRE